MKIDKQAKMLLEGKNCDNCAKYNCDHKGDVCEEWAGYSFFEALAEAAVANMQNIASIKKRQRI